MKHGAIGINPVQDTKSVVDVGWIAFLVFNVGLILDFPWVLATLILSLLDMAPQGLSLRETRGIIQKCPFW